MRFIGPKRLHRGVAFVNFEGYRVYGKTTWRKVKGIGKISLADGTVRLAELHWYEGHGKGKKETIKRYLE